MQNYANVLRICILTCSFVALSRADDVDDYVRGQMQKKKIPGLSLAVVKEGKVVKAQGYGLASIELQVPATGHTVYEIGSISKQFTSTEGRRGMRMMVKFID